MLPEIEVIVGTYEEFLLGYKLEIKNAKPTLSQSFADKSHAGAIKCLAVQSHWLATGSTDDRIFVYDMRSRKQTEIILSHEGTINALKFTPDNSYLFSGGDDGRMIATHVGNWTTNAAWPKAHDGKAVTHISCHPSGKLALTLGADLVLRTWNLVKGRVAYKKNLKSRSSLGHVAEYISWSPTGDHFSLSGQRIIEIWSIQKADVVRSLKTQSKPTCISWIDKETCIAGLEDGKIIWFNLDENEKEKVIEVHETRVKDISVRDNIMATASSSGDIKVWQINSSKKELKEIAATNIGCRPTCIGILDLKQFGADYNIDTNEQEEKPNIQNIKRKSSPPRGVVTIEYENGDDDEESNSAEKSAEDSSPNHDEDEEDSSDESSEQSSEEEEVLKPKKRKVQQKQTKYPMKSKNTNSKKKKGK